MAVTVLSTVFLTAQLRADDPARADFQSGVQLQQSKQYGPAIRAYLKAIQENPNYVGIYKSVGTCYYYAGDKRGALYYYHLYLRSYPNDQSTASFVQSLEGSSSASAEGGSKPQHENANMPTGFDLRLAFGGLYNDGSDINTFLIGDNPDPAVSTSLSGSFGYYIGLGGDYVFQNGFLLGLDVMDGPNRSYTLTLTDGPISDSINIDISSFSFFVSPGWRFQVAPKILLEPRVGLGYTNSSINISSDIYSASGTANGFSAWPMLRAEYEMGAWGIGLSLGYLIASLSPVTGSNSRDESATFLVVNSDGTTSNWTMNNGGPTFGLDLTYHFGTKE